MAKITQFYIQTPAGIKPMPVQKNFEVNGRVFCVHYNNDNETGDNLYAVSDHKTGFRVCVAKTKAGAERECREKLERNPGFDFSYYPPTNSDSFLLGYEALKTWVTDNEGDPTALKGIIQACFEIGRERKNIGSL